jgi:NAD(P)-dependent dehydrogenase (short-subunit alcohol dehydrogenase family)
MENIAGSTAFVTGAANGIGLAIAEALLAAGARVVLADIGRADLESQVERLGANARGFVLDVADRGAWDSARRFVEDWSGPVDILVNNAGIGGDTAPLTDMSGDSFDLLLRIKLNGTFNGVHTFVPGMRDRRSGHVVNTASMAGLTVMPRLGAYTTAMFGLVGLTEVLRSELAPYGVGVSLLCPGRTRTRLSHTTAAINPAPTSLTDVDDVLPVPSSPSLSILEPEAVAAMVLEAIQADELYVLTHPEYADRVATRAAALADAFRLRREHGGPLDP